MKVKQDFLHFGSFTIKDGSQAWFWVGKWLGNSPLSEQYPFLYNMTRRKQHTVAEVFTSSPINISWRSVVLPKEPPHSGPNGLPGARDPAPAEATGRGCAPGGVRYMGAAALHLYATSDSRWFRKIEIYLGKIDRDLFRKKELRFVRKEESFVLGKENPNL